MRLQGDWVIIPDDAVVTQPNKFGRAVVWPYMSAKGETQSGASCQARKVHCRTFAHHRKDLIFRTGRKSKSDPSEPASSGLR